MVTVFLVDDHEVVRRGVADLLEDEDDLTVVGQAARSPRRWTGFPLCAQTSRYSTSAFPTATASRCAATCAPRCPGCAA